MIHLTFCSISLEVPVESLKITNNLPNLVLLPCTLRMVSVDWFVMVTDSPEANYPILEENRATRRSTRSSPGASAV